MGKKNWGWGKRWEKRTVGLASFRRKQFSLVTVVECVMRLLIDTSDSEQRLLGTAS